MTTAKNTENTQNTHDDELVMLAAYPLYHDQAARIDAALAGCYISEAEALRERQRLFGICSDGDCDQPIAGYHGHGPKLCLLHLAGYLRRIEQQKGAAADPAEGALLAAATQQLQQFTQVTRQYAAALTRLLAVMRGEA